MDWSKKQKRCFHRLMSGLYKHRFERLRFLTLTSAENMEKNIQESFRILKGRMFRIKPYQLIDKGWIEYSKACRIYGEENLGFPLSRFDYLKVSTGEGVDGVIHVLFYGFYYPQEWLSECWKDITGVAYIVDIRHCKSKSYDIRKLASYCINQYVSGQSQFLRFFCSRNWCFIGFIKIWNFVKKRFSFPTCEFSYGKPVRRVFDIDGLLDYWHFLIDNYPFKSLIQKHLEVKYADS